VVDEFRAKITTESQRTQRSHREVSRIVIHEHAILKAQPKATFIQSETTEYFHAEDPECVELALFHQ